MPRRNRWRVGDHLMRDDESGRVHYASDMVRRWDGHFVRRDQYETRQPQEFVRAYKDPVALTNVRPDQDTGKTCNFIGVFVGATAVPVPRGPAAHLFDPGVGEMEVGCTWVVR